MLTDDPETKISPLCGERSKDCRHSGEAPDGKTKSLSATVQEPQAQDPEPGHSPGMPWKKLEEIVSGLIALGILFCGLLWGYGFFSGFLDSGNICFLEYFIRLNDMNSISRHGYKTYMENFTDLKKIRKEIHSAMDESLREAEEIQRTMKELQQGETEEARFEQDYDREF